MNKEYGDGFSIDDYDGGNADDFDGGDFEAGENTGALTFSVAQDSILDGFKREQADELEEALEDDPEADEDLDSLEDTDDGDASEEFDPAAIIEELQDRITTDDLLEVLDELAPLFGVRWVRVSGSIKLFGNLEDKDRAYQWLRSRRRYMTKDGRLEWGEHARNREIAVKYARDTGLKNEQARNVYHAKKQAGLLKPRKKAETLEERVEESVKLKLRRVRKSPEFEALPNKQAKDALIDQLRAEYPAIALERLEKKARKDDAKRIKEGQAYAVAMLRAEGHTMKGAKQALNELTDRLIELSVLIAKGPGGLTTESDIRLFTEEAAMLNQRIRELSGSDE